MKAVVFDMDGVLFDTERLCKDCWCEVAKMDGMKDMEVVFPKCIGSNSTDTKQIILEHYGKDFDYEGFSQRASQLFWDYIAKEGMPVKTGVKELLEYLKQEGYAIGLASSTKKESVVSHLQRTEIDSYFSVLVTGDMIQHSKPEPEIYEIACRELGVEPKDAMAIEDSYNGIRSAYRAGMMPVMVPDLIAPDEEMETLSYKIFKDLLEVLAFVKELH